MRSVKERPEMKKKANPDEGDSPHHGLKHGCRKALKDKWRRGTEAKLGEICQCFSALEEVELKPLARNGNKQTWRKMNIKEELVNNVLM